MAQTSEADERSARIAALEQHERDLVFDSFTQLDAWRLGSLVTSRALAAGQEVAVDVRRAGFVLFRAALPGTTADQQEWIRRKSALVLRMESSSALLAERFAASGVDPSTTGWLDVRDYALAGGSFPVRVRGVGVVAAITASGLTSAEDHDLVTSSIAAYLAEGAAGALLT